MNMSKKLRVGWFSFSCSEDSTIIFTELLNDHYLTWKNLIDFKAILPLQKREELKNLDVAFVEGAITSAAQEDKLIKIRKSAKKLVAVGACACVGMPSGQRNIFKEKSRKEIETLLIRFQYAKKVKKISEVVTVDDQVPGCPMEENTFMQILNKYFKEFGIVRS
ncbi:hypothetical protein FJY90_01280 [Candidatus Gottesmanbacteria bacterium]|nr:hypothetical protein [Candidatus Gottesmanbacteria bacterium]